MVSAIDMLLKSKIKSSAKLDILFPITYRGILSSGSWQVTPAEALRVAVADDNVFYFEQTVNGVVSDSSSPISRLMDRVFCQSNTFLMCYFNISVSC